MERDDLLEVLAFRVRQMRDAQRDFSTTHSKEAQRDSMRLEKAVDETLRKIEAADEPPAPEQMEMFGA